MNPVLRPRRLFELLQQLACLSIALLLLAACASPQPPVPGQLSFAVLGDMPYSEAESQQLDQMIQAINADPSVQFVLHVGDIKSSAEPCTDALLQERFRQLQQFRKPLIYTPGDNEWTDCHRLPAGRHHPLERLATLRKLFFSEPQFTSGLRMPVRSQGMEPTFSEFVENVVFRQSDVLVASVHVVGSGNGLEPWRSLDASDSTAQPRAERIAAFQQRQAAALAWLDTVFAQAERDRARAIVLLMQANPMFERAAADPRRAGFNAVVDRLAQRAGDSRLPVLLVHGDFHSFLHDRPLPERAPNLWRVQTYGSPWMRWVKVTVQPAAVQRDAGNANGVFRVEPR